MSVTAYRHIELDANGVPHLAGTPTKVVEIALERIAHHWDAEQIQRQHPDLTLAQVHSALAYYYDHQQELDDDIEQRRRRADEIFDRLGPATRRDKLHAARRGRP